MVLAAAIAGAAIGLLWPAAGLAMEPVATIFLRLVRSIIAPLIFATLTAGIAGSGNLKSIGRTGLKAAVFFLTVSTIALLLGYVAAEMVQPGAGVISSSASSGPAGTPPGLASILESAVPSSIFDAMARGEVLQIVVFSILFGAASIALKKTDPVIAFVESVGAWMLRY